jgi:hypothetical protein
MSDEANVVVDPELVNVRDFSEQDVGQLIDYWYHSAPGFIKAMGIDPRKLLPEREFEKWMISQSDSKKRVGGNRIAISWARAVAAPVTFKRSQGADDIRGAHGRIWRMESQGRRPQR